MFKNYLIAKEKFQPDYFLYENNKSMAVEIRSQIDNEFTKEFENSEDWHETKVGLPSQKNCMVKTYTHKSTKETAEISRTLINSALVSAQNRQRYYWSNIPGISVPEDRGILVKDIIETIYVDTAPVAIAEQVFNRKKNEAGEWERIYEAREDKKANCLTTNLHRSMVAVPLCAAQRGRFTDGRWQQEFELRTDGKTNTITTVEKDNFIVEPIKVGNFEKKCQGYGIYSIDGKSVVITASGGGAGRNSGLYALPVNIAANGKAHTVKAQYSNNTIANFITNGGFSATGIAEAVEVINDTDNEFQISFSANSKNKVTVYRVLNGQITIKGKQYPIKLTDGHYIIRKLTVLECKRLQTVREDYKMPCSSSQNYKMLGNGWTVEVIAHILSHIPNLQDYDIEVLSMYDGMSCGNLALERLGCNVVKYVSYEIDKHAVATTQENFPFVEQRDDAFKVRKDNWEY